MCCWSERYIWECQTSIFALWKKWQLVVTWFDLRLKKQVLWSAAFFPFIIIKVLYIEEYNFTFSRFEIIYFSIIFISPLKWKPKMFLLHLSHLSTLCSLPCRQILVFSWDCSWFLIPTTVVFYTNFIYFINSYAIKGYYSLLLSFLILTVSCFEVSILIQLSLGIIFDF